MPKKQKAADGAQAGEDALSGTLEEYFASHRGSGEVSAHLLIGTPSHDAMASEPIDSGDSGEPNTSPASEESDGAAPSLGVAHGQRDDAQIGDDDQTGDDGKPIDNKGQAEDTSVAGLTLGDYMNVVVNESSESLSTKKKAEKKPSVAAKSKPKPKSSGVVVPGMSLDSYLGVAADEDGESDEHSDQDDHGDDKAVLSSKKSAMKALSPPKEAKKPGKSKPLGLPLAPPSLDDSATPFQRHQKKKQSVKSKLQQQQQGAAMAGSGSAGPVSKSILMAEPLLVAPVHDPAKSTRKKPKAASQLPAPHHQSSPSASPLPKLASSPLVAQAATAADHAHFGPPSSITSATGAHHHGTSSSDTSSSTDKLPPL